MPTQKQASKNDDELVKLDIEGIQFEINPVAVQDLDFVLALSELQELQDKISNSSENDTKLNIKMFETLNQAATYLFSDWYTTIKNEIREKNNGYLPIGVLSSLVIKTVEEVSKNS